MLDRFKPKNRVVNLQPTMHWVQRTAARPAFGRTTRNVRLRCLEYTHEFHRLQWVIGLASAVYQLLRVHTLFLQTLREANRNTASLILRHESSRIVSHLSREAFAPLKKL